MPVDTLDKTTGSLGPAITDARTPRANEFSAVYLERIKDALIEHADAINAGGGGGDVEDGMVALVSDGQSFRRVGSAVEGYTPVLSGDAASFEQVYLSGEQFGTSPNRYRLLSVGVFPDLSQHRFYLSEVAPNSVIEAGIGSICLVRYPSANANDGLWVKETGALSTTGWVKAGAGGVTDHGALTGLSDNDHPQYLLAAETSGPTTLALGSIPDGQVLVRSGSSIVGGQPLGEFITTVQVRPAQAGSSPERYAQVFTLQDGETDIGACFVYVAESSPEGVISTNPGSICLVRHPSADSEDGLWVKATGTGGTGWVQLGAAGSPTDHGALTGLGDDDHTQYLLADGSRTLSGNLTVTGTVDGRDVAADGTALDAHIAASNPHSGSTPTSRKIDPGTGLTGGGDFTADRVLSVSFGSSGSTVCVGNDARLSDDRTASGLRETSGPTLLTMGAVADGQVLVRSGTTVVGAAAPGAIVAPVTESGTTRTLTAGDHNQVILCTNAAGCAVTVPASLASSGGGFTCTLVQRGTAAVTAAGSGGLTVSPPATFDPETAELNSPLTIYVESSTVALCWGDLVPA